MSQPSSIIHRVTLSLSRYQFSPRSSFSPSSLLTTTTSTSTRRHASLLRRPKRPYTFTQLVQLSDGSTFTHRTTSPQPVLKSNKDTRNSPLWNPSSVRLLNLEEDQAGRLRAFREKFGRSWDAEQMYEDREGEDNGGEQGENLMDLISGYAKENKTGEENKMGEESKKRKKSEKSRK